MAPDENSLAQKICQKLSEIPEIEEIITQKMIELDKRLADTKQLTWEERCAIQYRNQEAGIGFERGLLRECETQGKLIKRIRAGGRNQHNTYAEGYLVINYALNQQIRIYADDLYLLKTEGIIMFREICFLDDTIAIINASDEELRKFFRLA